MGSATDRMLALGGVVRALSTAADKASALTTHLPGSEVRDELADFTRRNRVVSPL